MYPGGAAADAVVPKDAPPAFFCVAFDDKGPSKTSLELFQKLKDAGVTAELHVYSQGGHGFGMRNRASADHRVAGAADGLDAGDRFDTGGRAGATLAV
jgi:acetyl esterase/lipase